MLAAAADMMETKTTAAQPRLPSSQTRSMNPSQTATSEGFVLPGMPSSRPSSRASSRMPAATSVMSGPADSRASTLPRASQRSGSTVPGGSFQPSSTRCPMYAPSSPSQTSVPASSSSAQQPSTLGFGLATGSDAAPWLCAIFESRRAGREIGVALLNMETNRCILTQFADTQMYGHLLHLLEVYPAHIVILPLPHQHSVPSPFAAFKKTDILHALVRQNTGADIVTVPRRTFSEHQGQFRTAKRKRSCSPDGAHSLTSKQVPLYRGAVSNETAD